MSFTCHIACFSIINVSSDSGVTRGRTAMGDTLQGGDTRPKIFLRLNLERTLDKLSGKMGVMRRRQLKKVITQKGDFFQEKIG